MAVDLNAALRARRERLCREGRKSYAVRNGDGWETPCRDWATAVYVAARHLVTVGPCEAIELAWDESVTDPAYVVSRRRVFA